jgi:predicted nucleotidyltransferase
MPVTSEHIQQAVAVARSYGATCIILFGSAANSPDTARDLDLAVEGVRGWEFYQLVGHLLTAIPVPVDIVALEDAGDSAVGEEIRRYGKVLFGQQREVSHAA